MAFLLYDYLDARGNNLIAPWIGALQKAERAKLDERIHKLRNHGDELFPHILAGTDKPGILKLKVHGNVQLRPLLCKGPVLVHTEYTLLAGAKEVGSLLRPRDVTSTAVVRKTEVAGDPVNRRAIR